MDKSEFKWTEKYRPHKLEDVILPEHLKDIFRQFLEQRNIPDMILTGGPGIGKTTVAKAILEELDCDFIVLNSSLYGNIDTIRTEVLNFVSTVSFKGGRKYVIFDEADHMNPLSTQPALRNFMDEFTNNAGFIFTCNWLHKIIEPLHSRCSIVDFKIEKSEVPLLCMTFFKRVSEILDKEHVQYDKKVIAKLVEKYYPDWRRVINELQFYSSSGKVDVGIMMTIQDTLFKDLIGLIKAKNFTAIRKWVSDNYNNNHQEMFRKFYDTSTDFIKPNTIPLLVLLISKYQYQSAFAADQELNLLAFLTETLMEVEWL